MFQNTNGLAQLLSLWLSVLEVYGSIPEPVKSDTLLPTAHRCCDVSSNCVAQALSRVDGPRHSFHALAHAATIMIFCDFSKLRPKIEQGLCQRNLAVAE